jgi:hypothetical protein
MNLLIGSDPFVWIEGDDLISVENLFHTRFSCIPRDRMSFQRKKTRFGPERLRLPGSKPPCIFCQNRPKPLIFWFSTRPSLLPFSWFKRCGTIVWFFCCNFLGTLRPSLGCKFLIHHVLFHLFGHAYVLWMTSCLPLFSVPVSFVATRKASWHDME